MEKDTIDAINLSRKENVDLSSIDKISIFERKFQDLYNCRAKDIELQRKRFEGRNIVVAQAVFSRNQRDIIRQITLRIVVLPWAWRGGIADYHPNPEGWGNTLRTPERSDGGGGYCPTPKDEDGNQQYLRAMLTVLSLSLGENEMSVLSNTTLSIIRIFYSPGWYWIIPALFCWQKNAGIIQYHPLNNRNFFFYISGWFGIGKYQATRRYAFSFLPNDNVGYHFSSRLTATLNLCLIYLKLLVHVH